MYIHVNMDNIILKPHTDIIYGSDARTIQVPTTLVSVYSGKNIKYVYRRQNSTYYRYIDTTVYLHNSLKISLIDDNR